MFAAAHQIYLFLRCWRACRACIFKPVPDPPPRPSRANARSGEKVGGRSRRTGGARRAAAELAAVLNCPKLRSQKMQSTNSYRRVGRSALTTFLLLAAALLITAGQAHAQIVRTVDRSFTDALPNPCTG